MKSTYYSAAWTDSGRLLDCGHEHETLADAASCIPSAGGYVIGIEDGVMRSLKTEEESEFQPAIQNHLSGRPAPQITAPAVSAEQTRQDSGYAVIARTMVVDHWKWTTWMCFETYGQAVAHAREDDKVVRFASEEWAALKQQEWAQQRQTAPLPPIHAKGAPETLPSRVEGEPFVEFILRLLNALDPAGLLPIEGQEDDRSTSESKQTSKIETPTFVARLILSRLSESEIGKLDRMLDEDIPALLNALRGRSQTVAKKQSGCR